MSEILRIEFGACSSAGVKEYNQDFHGILVPEGRDLAMKGIAAAIADGISSSPVSHIASESAVKSFLTDYYCTSEAWTVKNAAGRVISSTNSWLHSQSKRSQFGSDMDKGYVCTFSGLIFKARKAHLFHAGDSRIARKSGRSMEVLTQDHRLVLSSQENYLARAMGMSNNIEIDYRQCDLQPGDVFVLSTDGVHEHVSDADMAGMLDQFADLNAAADAVAQAALDAGSRDNVTVMIVKIVQLPPADAESLVAETAFLPPPALPEESSEFDGYKIIRKLHANSRSHIYLAEEIETGNLAALKLPSVDQRDDPAYLKRFMMEEWIARRVTSPHVLKAAPPKRGRNFLYVVNEYIEGQSLRQWMRDNPTPDLETVRGIVGQIEKGLRAFHRLEMIHQDLRPENVMIDKTGTVKIIDFGSTRVAGVVEAEPEQHPDDILGTQQYAAPEYFVGESGTERSDLFSLAVIAYEMLTGKLPYGADVSRATTAKAQSKLRYRPARNSVGRIPDWVDSALKKALNPVPWKRQETAFEFTEDLRRPSADLVPGSGFVPLAERDPVVFWKVLCAFLAAALLFSLSLKF